LTDTTFFPFIENHHVNIDEKTFYIETISIARSNKLMCQLLLHVQIAGELSEQGSPGAGEKEYAILCAD
jgi:hypothetical protein